MIPSLETFALQVISDCVHNATLNLLQLLEVSSLEDIKNTDLPVTCKYLEKIITHIPHNLVNDVCEKLMWRVAYTACMYDKKRILHPTRKKSHLDIASALRNSILHSSVSKLDSPPFISNSVEFYLFREYLKAALQKVDSVEILALRTLHFSAEVLKNNEEKLKNLKELVVCNEDVLQKVIQVCPTLKKLEFAYPMCMSINCVDLISSLKHLQYLNIIYLPVSQHSITQIIVNLSLIQNSDNSVHSLKTLKCILTEDLATLVVKCFPHLISLKLIHKLHYSLIILKGLKELTDLEISCGASSLASFSTILKEYLTECGNQLLRLKLINIPETDLNFIAQQCPSLHNLGLSYSNQDNLGFSYEQPLHNVHLCEFLNVKYCELVINSYDLMRIILSKCLKLKVAFLNSDFDYLCIDNLKFFSQSMNEVKFRIRLGTGDTLCIWGNYKSISYLNGRTELLTIEEMRERFPNIIKE